MCRVLCCNYLECKHDDIRREYLVRCPADEYCNGVTAIEVPLPRHCEKCMSDDTDARRSTTPKSCAPRLREEVDRIFALAPKDSSPEEEGAPTSMRDPATKERHAYHSLRTHEWQEDISDEDLRWLFFLEKGLHEVWWEKCEMDKTVAEELLLFLHIRGAYLMALGKFLCRIRVNGLRHFQLEDAEPRVREERMPVLLKRLDKITTPVGKSELARLGNPKCVICQEKLGEAEEKPVKLPCGHCIGRECLRHWVESWDRESALRVCTLCKDGFDLTKYDPDDAKTDQLPGFERAPRGTIPTAGEVDKMIGDLLAYVASLPPGNQFNPPRPWWMKFLRGRWTGNGVRLGTAN
jgi:hypothetical protein